MRIVKFSVAAALAVTASVYCGATSFADNHSGFFISVSPGAYVEYVSLSDTGQGVTGYLESIRAAPGAPDGETRTQIFASAGSNGDVIVFGNRTASRSGDGYTLTYPTSTGQVHEQRFVRSTVTRVNGSIAALSSSVSRDQAQNSMNNVKAELSQDAHVTSAQALRIAQAQNSIVTARAQQVELQRKADALWLVARKLRVDANAAINTPGASFAQNQKSIDAMKVADDAAQSARAAQHDADAAGYTASLTETDLVNLRSYIASLTERARILSQKLKESGQTASHP